MQIPSSPACVRARAADFATLDLEYVPDRVCVELKSLSCTSGRFVTAVRNHEAVTNEIADHLQPHCRRASCA